MKILSSSEKTNRILLLNVIKYLSTWEPTLKSKQPIKGEEPSHLYAPPSILYCLMWDLGTPFYPSPYHSTAPRSQHSGGWRSTAL